MGMKWPRVRGHSDERAVLLVSRKYPVPETSEGGIAASGEYMARFGCSTGGIPEAEFCCRG